MKIPGLSLFSGQLPKYLYLLGWVSLLMGSSISNATNQPEPAKQPKPAKTANISPAKPKTTDKTPEDPEDGTAYRVLQQFAGSVFQFSRIVADPENPATIKSALCAMLAHWVQIFAEITRHHPDNTDTNTDVPESTSPSRPKDIPLAKTVVSILDQQQLHEIDQFICSLDEPTKQLLLKLALYTYAAEARFEVV